MCTFYTLAALLCTFYTLTYCVFCTQSLLCILYAKPGGVKHPAKNPIQKLGKKPHAKTLQKTPRKKPPQKSSAPGKLKTC